MFSIHRLNKTGDDILLPTRGYRLIFALNSITGDLLCILPQTTDSAPLRFLSKVSN